MKTQFYILITIIFILTGCGGGGGSSDNTTNSNTSEETNNTGNSNEEQTNTVHSNYSNEIEYLNNFRKNSGMIELNSNTLLNTAAQNHADYILVNNTSGHGETLGANNFTGESPSDRAYYVNYQSGVSENIAYASTYEKSIDSLFTAIYHRFGFLNFEIDEVGISQKSNTAKTKHASVYNMGNKNINDLCLGDTFNGFGTYYTSVCKDSSFKIEGSVYENAKNTNRNANPEIVTWPYDNQEDFQPVFYEENPDPLPNCSVTGNPISVQFNDTNVNTLEMTSFKLYDKDDSEILNTTVLNENTDPNNKFSNKEFALFPMERLDWNTSYKAIFNYKENSVSKSKTINFKTRNVDYPLYIVENSTTTLNLKSGVMYAIYIKPTNCNDTSNSYSASYTSGLVIEKENIDSQTLAFKLTGNIGSHYTITLANNSTIRLEVSSSDTAIR